VLAVLSAADFRAAGVGNLSRPIPMVGRGGAALKVPYRPALSAAKYVARVSLVNRRLIVSSMEPRGTTAQFDPRNGVYTLRCGTHEPTDWANIRHAIAATIHIT